MNKTRKVFNRFLSILLIKPNGAVFLGSIVVSILENIGIKVRFIIVSVASIFSLKFYFKNFYKQFIEIAFFSIPVVGLTAVFTGMVLVLQSYTGFSRFSAEGAVANVVVLSISRELGPVLTALMVAGRIASSMAAEVGTMRVSEQIDALYTMGVNSIRYLITPRILAGILALPLLVLMSDILGVMGGFVIAIAKLHFSPTVYLRNSWAFVTFWDVTSGLIKGAVFGILITTMGCFFGYYSSNGAKGVGKATTNAVVTSSILIFVFDYLLTLIFFNT